RRSAHRRRRRLLPHQSPDRFHYLSQRARVETDRAAAVARHAHHHRHADALRKNRRHQPGEEMKHDRTLAYAAFAVICIVWGTTYLAIRIAVTTMTPFLLTGARFLFGGIVLFIVAKLH